MYKTGEEGFSCWPTQKQTKRGAEWEGERDKTQKNTNKFAYMQKM